MPWIFHAATTHAATSTYTTVVLQRGTRCCVSRALGSTARTLSNMAVQQHPSASSTGNTLPSAAELAELLEAALADSTVLHTRDLPTLNALLELAETRVTRLYDTSNPSEAVLKPLADVISFCWLTILEQREWTLFVSCTGDGGRWVQAGESRAIAAFEQWLGFDPFDSCSRCGDQIYHVVETRFDETPPADADVIDADEVQRLLAANEASAPPVS